MNQERKRILELVQEGKLSAQEALILLDALEQNGSKEKEADQEHSKEEKQTTQQQTASFDDTEQANHSTKAEPTNEQKEKKENEQHDDSFYSQLENAGEKIFDFVSNALNKIKNFDFQFAQAIEVPHTFQQMDDNIEKIDIDVANGPVKIVTWDQPETRVECQAKVYRSEDRENARNYFLENTVFSIENGLFVFATQSKWMRVDTVIYVPKKNYSKISLRAFNGGISADALQGNYVTAKTTNGKVELVHLEGEKFDIDTVNGQISLIDSKATSLEAETVNGSVDVKGTYENIELQSLNGNIVCTIPELGINKIEANVVTGNIHLTIPNTSSVDGEVRSNLGSYKLDLENINVLHEKKEVIQKQVRFKRGGLDERIIHIVADTKTGTVHIKEAEIQGV